MITELFVREKVRVKRAWNSLGSVISDITGLMDHDDKKKMKDNLAKVKDNQETLVEDSKAQKHELVKVFEEIKSTELLLNNVTDQIQRQLKTFRKGETLLEEDLDVIARVSQAADEFSSKADAVMSLLANHKITGRIIKFDILKAACDRILARNTDGIEHFPFDSVVEIAASSQVTVRVVMYLVLTFI